MQQIMDYLAGALALRSGVLTAYATLLAMTIAASLSPALAAPRATEFKLANGMDVVVVPDHRAPVVTHMVWYRVGAADEVTGESGIAHFLEHLMFKGTDKIPPGQFSKIVARNGGEDNAFTSHDATSYFQRVAKDRLPLVMEMEADRMANLKLGEQDVLTERKVILEERRSRVDNDPSSILQEQMMAALYQNHPYGVPVIGWEHEMEELSREDAIDFYKRYYGPDNAILVVAGDVTPEEVKTLAQQTYGKLSARGGFAKRVRPKEPKHAAPVRVQLTDARAGQATMQRFYLAPSYHTAAPREAEALDLLMKIVGGGSTSRLYKKLVVEEKKASGAGGWYGASGLDSSRIGVYAVVGSDSSVEDVEKALDAVLDDVRKNGVTQAELDRARNKLLANFIYSADSQSRLARRYGWGLSNGLTLADIDAWPERLKQVTLEDLKRVAQRYLDPRESVTGVLLPAHTEPRQSAKARQNEKS